MNYVLSRWNALYLAALLLVVWPSGVEAASYSVSWEDGRTSGSTQGYRYRGRYTYNGTSYWIQWTTGAVLPGASGTSGGVDLSDPLHSLGFLEVQGQLDTGSWNTGVGATWTGSVSGGNGFIYLGDVPEETCPHVITAQNTTLFTKRYYWILNGDVIYAEDVHPGHSRTHTITPPDCDAYEVELYETEVELGADYELLSATNTIFLADNGTHPAGGTNGVVAPWTPKVQQNAGGILDSTNLSPVTFSAGASTNTARSVQEGFAAQMSQQQQMDQKALELLAQIQQNTGATATNTADALAVATNFLFAATNGLSQAALEGIELSHVAWLTSYLESKMGEVEDIIALAHGDAMDYFDAGVGTIPASPAGSKAVPMQISMAYATPTLTKSYVINADPEAISWLPGFLSLAKAVAAWLVVFFGYKRMYEAITETYGRWIGAGPISQGGQQAIAGFNVTLPWRIVISGLLIAFMASIPALYYTLDKTHFGENPFSAMAGNSIWSTALYYAHLAVPIDVVFAAIVSFWTLKMTLGLAEVFKIPIARIMQGL